MIKNYFNITWSLLEFDVKFKKFRCESAMFIFKWKVTWNYVYIVPLNDWVKMNEKQKQCLLHNCCISCKLVEFLLKRGCRWFYILLFLPTWNYSSNFHSEIKFHYYSPPSSFFFLHWSRRLRNVPLIYKTGSTSKCCNALIFNFTPWTKKYLFCNPGHKHFKTIQHLFLKRNFKNRIDFCGFFAWITVFYIYISALFFNSSPSQSGVRIFSSFIPRSKDVNSFHFFC